MVNCMSIAASVHLNKLLDLLLLRDHVTLLCAVQMYRCLLRRMLCVTLTALVSINAWGHACTIIKHYADTDFDNDDNNYDVVVSSRECAESLSMAGVTQPMLLPSGSEHVCVQASTLQAVEAAASQREASAAAELQSAASMKVRALMRVSELTAQLDERGVIVDALLADVEEATHKGTPRGEGAKQVLSMAYKKIRDLQEVRFLFVCFLFFFGFGGR